MVSSQRAHSAAVGSPASPGPNRTTSSPGGDDGVRGVGGRPEVDHDLVHAHAPDDRSAPTGQLHRHRPSEPSGHPVGVPRGDQCEYPVAGSDPFVTVRDTFPGGDPFDQRDPGAERHDRTQSVMVRRLERVEAVDGDAGPDEVEVQVGAGEGGRGVGQVPPRGGAAEARRRRTPGLVEAGGLDVDRRVGGGVGVREVRPDGGDLDLARDPGVLGGVEQLAPRRRAGSRCGSARYRS